MSCKVKYKYLDNQSFYLFFASGSFRNIKKCPVLPPPNYTTIAEKIHLSKYTILSSRDLNITKDKLTFGRIIVRMTLSGHSVIPPLFGQHFFIQTYYTKPPIS